MPDFGDRRIMACSPADLQRWLGELCGAGAAAPGGFSAVLSTPHPGMVGAFTVAAHGFTLTLDWRVLEPRRIALLRVGQIEVEFGYPPEALAEARAWIARFDRHTQRGGG